MKQYKKIEKFSKVENEETEATHALSFLGPLILVGSLLLFFLILIMKIVVKRELRKLNKL